MDSLFDKLGLYDFFNVIFSGGIFIIIYILMYPQRYIEFCENINSTSERGIIFAFVSYLLGLFFQELGSLFDDKILKTKRGMTSIFLNYDNDVIDDNSKKSVYRSYAKKILKKNKLNVKGDTFSITQNEYVFSYCAYYIENKKKNAKSEKMRALYGMAKNLLICFVVILLILICEVINKYPSLSCADFYGLLVTCIAILLTRKKMERSMKYMIRMVMAIYESCKDE